MCVDESNVKSKAKGVKFWPFCISNTINTFLDVLMNKFLKHLLPFRNVDHNIEVVPSFTPPFKSPYKFNKRQLKNIKVQINDLMEWGYIRPSKLPYGSPILFMDKNDKKLYVCTNYMP
jgi:hypothetical protein